MQYFFALPELQQLNTHYLPFPNTHKKFGNLSLVHHLQKSLQFLLSALQGIPYDGQEFQALLQIQARQLMLRGLYRDFCPAKEVQL